VGGVKTTYTLFNFTLSPALAVTPDSVVIAFASSDLITSNGLVGSTLLLDNISLTGVSSQPTQMNGNFELWQNQTVTKPNSWYFDNRGFSQTTDVAAGNYAMQLTTYNGNQNGIPRAQPGQISTGYWDNSCNCQKGGQPFTNQIDTLEFSYKYAPSGNDSAQVFLNFKKNSVDIFGTGINLPASAVYQVVDIPFNIGQIPDTAIVQVQSSLWQDSATSFIGSTLKIDEIHFKTQPLVTGIINYMDDSKISVYPNPTTGKVTVYGAGINAIEVYNAIGEKVYTNSNTLKQITNEINLSSFKKGIYLFKIQNGNLTQTRKVIVE